MFCPRGGRVLLLLLLLAGCAGRAPDASWGGRWPSAQQLRTAALDGVRSPGTWAPLAAAAVLAVGDSDDDLSRWAVRETPLFGSRAESASDTLRSTAQAAWLITALAAPSPSPVDRLSGLAVGASALAAARAITSTAKSVSDRRRPDGGDRRSFPSGHAASASVAAALARGNLDHVGLARPLDRGLRLTLHGVAAATAWARVEAEKHHVTDVLVGYALGNAIAVFVQQAWLEPAPLRAEIAWQALPGGGAITLRVGI